jgi:predicted dehydrogenase
MSNGTQPVRLVMIGCGGMARHHVRRILQQQETTKIVATCEPSGQSYENICAIFEEVGVTPPPNEPNLEKLLQERAGEIDAAFIITPHVLHHDQAVACLEAGIDVLLEKPMVMTAAEAENLIAVRDRTQRLLVVSFNGSLSPQIRTAVKMLRSGTLGNILNVHSVAWQSWKNGTMGTWRQNPVMSGGGFLFDTGAHMLNTVSDLVGEEFTEVAAWLDNRGTPVDILGSVMARTASGAFITMSACGDQILPFGCTCLLYRGHFAHRHLGRTSGGAAQRTRAAHACARACVDGAVGTVPQRARREVGKSLPAGDWATHGAIVGCDPGFRRARRAAHPHLCQ